VEKAGYSWNSWRNLLRTELDQGRPMVYRGFGSGGHAFNLDGYDEDDYFHFNWGWGGSYNGWFLLTALEPGGYDFSDDQAAIIGLEPMFWHHPPVLLAPADGAGDVHAYPVVFDWAEEDGADSYALQVDDNSSFSSPEVSLEGLQVTGYASQELEYYKLYHWRVRSSGDYGDGPWSAPHSFTTEYGPYIPPPNQISPLDGTDDANYAPAVFVWNFVPGAESYGLQVDEDDDFVSPVIHETGLSANYLITELLEPETEYHWRINCLGPPGNSEWSEPWSLTTRPEEQVDLPPGELDDLPVGWALEQNVPNPFNPATTISFELPRPAELRIRVLNILGQEVALMAEGRFPAGRHDLVWEPAGLGSGVYFCVLESGEFNRVMKMTLLR